MKVMWELDEYDIRELYNLISNSVSRPSVLEWMLEELEILTESGGYNGNIPKLD